MKKYTVYSRDSFKKLFVTKNSGIFSFLNPYNSLFCFDNEGIIYGVDSFYLARLFLNTTNVSFDNSSFAPYFFSYCVNHSLKVLFIGATDDQNRNFIINLRRAYPSIICSGLGGYNELQFYSFYLKKNPYDIVVIGTGSPHQENLALYLFSIYQSLKIITCGGYIRQASFNLNYFPFLFRILNLKFLYRFFVESHVFKRTLIFYPKFFFYLLYGKIKFKSTRE